MTEVFENFDMPVPGDCMPGASVIWNRTDEALALKLRFPKKLVGKLLGWGRVSVLDEDDRKYWVKSEFKADGSITLRLTKNNIEGACLEAKRIKRKVYFTLEYYSHRIVHKHFSWLEITKPKGNGRGTVELLGAGIVRDSVGKALVLKPRTVSRPPADVCALTFPRSPGRKEVSSRKSNGRAKPVPVPKPAAAVAPPEQRTPPVSSWPESNIATPAISTIPYAYGSLETRLGIVENQCLANEDNCNALEADLKALKETVAALKGSDVKTGKPETGFNETQKRQLGGIVKTVVIAQRRQSLEAEIERLKRVPEARTVTNPVAAAFFDQLKAKKAAGQERKDA